MKFEFADFRKGYCEQFNTKPEMFYALWKLASGDPCTTGCPWFGKGACLGYKRIIRDKAQTFPINGSFLALTNAGLAKKLGVSKRQISKMRKAGRLIEAIKDYNTTSLSAKVPTG